MGNCSDVNFLWTEVRVYVCMYVYIYIIHIAHIQLVVLMNLNLYCSQFLRKFVDEIKLAFDSPYILLPGITIAGSLSQDRTTINNNGRGLMKRVLKKFYCSSNMLTLEWE